jgi:adenylate cyclase
MTPLNKKTLQGLAVSALAALFALGAWAPGWLELWEARAWDWRVRLLAKPGPRTEDIRLILLDQASLDWGKNVNGLGWPWPRETCAAIASFCKRAGAKALALDVLFTEPSKYGVADDQNFGRAAAGFGRTTTALFLGAANGESTSWPPEVKTPLAPVAGFETWRNAAAGKAAVFPRAAFPIPEIANGMAGLGNVQLDPDPDGVYRRAQPLRVFDGRPVPILGLALGLAGGDLKGMTVGEGFFGLQDQRFPLDKDGALLLNFRGPVSVYQAVNAAAVIQSEIQLQSGATPSVDPAFFKDKYVLYGYTAPGLFDLRSTPVSGVYPGVGVHATLLDNLLTGDLMRPAPTWAVLILVLGVALAAGLSATYFSAAWQGALLLPCLAGLPLAGAILAYRAGIQLPLLAQEVAVLAALMAAGAANYATEGRQKRFIKNAFKQYLSPTVIEQLIQNPERLKLGGERRVLSIFFSDLQGFTTISEGLEPEQLTELLNEYLTGMTDIIYEEGGTVDKFEGDAIIAFWNAPLEQPDHAARAVRAALRCQERLAEQRPHFFERVGKQLYMRIGLNTGPAVVGNMGSHSRFDYTMLGDSVNLAARLEGVNKQFGSYLMVSEATRDAAGPEFAARELAQVGVVGKRLPVRVFEPMRPEAYAANRETYERFAQGLALFYRGEFAQAKALFDEQAATDPPSASLSRKCQELLDSPPESWAGVWTMSSK